MNQAALSMRARVPPLYRASHRERCLYPTMQLLPSKLPRASGFGRLGPRAWVNSGPEEIMAALSRDAHRRRVLEHQAKVEADRGKPVPTPIRSSSDPQLEIRLIGEVKLTDETVEPKRGRRRSRKRAQPNLGV